MPCRTVLDSGGTLAIACTRGSRAPCGTPGCNGASVALCDWMLGGKRTGKTCDRQLCANCRMPAGANRDFCRPHAEMAARRMAGGIAVAHVGARSFQALHLVRDEGLILPAGHRIVSGHAAGVDIVAEITARQRGGEPSIHPIATRSGASKAAFTAAAMARNTLIADEALSGVAWVNPSSRGTYDTIGKMKMMGKAIEVREEPPPAEWSLLVHTAPHPNTRQAAKGYRGPSMFDVTRGTGGKAGDPFAPSQALLSEAQRRMADDGPEAGFAWYEPRYVESMRRSWVRSRSAWDALLARNHCVLACYCSGRDEDGTVNGRCHRLVLARLLVRAGEKVGRRVVDGGEVVC